MSPIASLDGRRLVLGLRAGIRRIIADQERLNRINVFPVPDGDTGTNLALTMSAVRAALDEHDDPHVGRTLELVADAALDGARGNSGAIIAQFFQGLGDACAEMRELTTDNFIDAVRHGAAYAREALSEPREGTILTVVSDYSAELVRRRGRGHDFATLLETGLARAQEALARTTQQLEVLRKAGVVDAGAQGFVDLLQGVTDFIRHGPSAADGDLTPTVEAPVAETLDGIAAAGDDGFRYCTECVVTAEGIDRNRLRESLAGIGGSLVVAGTRRKVRVHAHVDAPDRLFEIARGFGTVSSQKADDMHRQRAAASARRRQVAVVTDSAGDWPDEAFERLAMHMVPVRVHFGDKSYLDKVSLSPDAFYAKLQTDPHHPTTSQPAPGDFRRMYQFLASNYAAVISIHVSGQVSGTFQAAEAAAKRVTAESDDARVVAIDSRSA
jgi:dihydroxyacetone kinase-like predicted kinase